jgi:hypothetical protein
VTWTCSEPEADAPATASQEIRDAALKIRRARLAHIVRGVVVLSALVCVAGVASRIARAVGSADADALVVARHAGSAGRDLPAPGQIVVSTDSLSARTVKAVHVDERRAASRGKKSSRSRYNWL